MADQVRRIGAGMQSALRLVYPPRCICCGEAVASEFGLCGRCWKETPFVGGLVCDGCGLPLPGEDQGRPELCDDCMAMPRPWNRGRAALLYDGNGRKLVLALKHGDRQDLVRPFADWLLRAAGPLLAPGMLAAPVPLHWTRLLRRRFNQSALLSAALARAAGIAHCPDLLVRARRTGSQDGRGREERFANLSGAMRAHPRRAGKLEGRPVLLVDDVMTSGATLSAAAEACLAGGATGVSVLVLARVAKET